MDYASEKLQFVSNHNGTTLNDIVALLTLFPLINFLSILAKVFGLFYLNSKCLQTLNKNKLRTYFGYKTFFNFC